MGMPPQVKGRHIFSEPGPAESKSGPADSKCDCDMFVGLPKTGVQLTDRFAAGVNINQVTTFAILYMTI